MQTREEEKCREESDEHKLKKKKKRGYIKPILYTDYYIFGVYEFFFLKNYYFIQL